MNIHIAQFEYRPTSDNIFDSECAALVNPVNQVGVMGAGLAKQFKIKFPDYYLDYLNKCKNNKMCRWTPDIYKTKMDIPKYIVSFPTKYYWKDKSNISDIQQGMHSLRIAADALSIRSIAIPPVGCGLGGLNWNEVKPIIETAFRNPSTIDRLIAIYYPPE